MEENVSQKEKEKAEEEMIEQAFQELLNDYLATKHRKRVEIITKAFNFANQAHKGIKRRSGEPYIMHPIAVAKIVCNEIGLGSTSICSALLHDVVEDTDYTVEDIENIFGPKIAQIVDGLTKISGGIFGDRASAQAENFKKLLLTMSDDIRVILIKIADRLHNMRTLGSMLPNKQFKIAGETLYIYAPLANRLGLYKIKTELENLSFRYEHPEEYRESFRVWRIIRYGRIPRNRRKTCSDSRRARQSIQRVHHPDTRPTGQNGIEIPHSCPRQIHLLHLEQDANQACAVRGNL